ncbi:MAG: hypothetical protein PHI19_05140 [Clostridia bacterium]|nr:hypothetical protein [Clostridia bacterium]
MKKTNFFSIFIAVILIGVLCLTLCACNKDTKSVENIRIVSGSFKEVYDLDEQLDYDRIYIVATYVDGSTKQLKVEQSWISGWDVSTTGNNKSLTITYLGASVNFIYSVNYKASVTTPIRLAATKEEQDGKKAVVLGLNGLDKMSVYAVKVELTLNGMTYTGKEDKFPDSWDVAVHESETKVSLLFYSKNGADPLTGEGGLAKVFLNGEANSIHLKMEVSDGVSDHNAPDFSLVLKEQE